MSKSMNKYHKCMSELGRSMSGWVKVGALAVGVGVGGWSPGGGVSKAWAGNYRLEVQAKQGICSFFAEDLGTGEKGKFSLEGQKVAECDDSTVAFLGLHSGTEGVSFRLGSFIVYFRAFQDVVIYGGSLSDSISVASAVPVEMPGLNKVYADSLVFENVSSLCLQSRLLCSSLVFLKCGKVLLYKLASVSADCVFVSDSTVVNQGALRCDYFLPYDDCHLSGFEKARIGLSDKRKRKEVIVLDGIEQNDEDSGCFATLDGDSFVSWLPFEEDVGVPFSCQDCRVSREYDDRKRCFYGIQHLKKPICVFVGKIRDICGSSVAAHEKRVCFRIEDASGKVLESLVQGAVKSASFTRFICPLHLKDATGKITFKILGQCTKCPRSVVSADASIVLFAE